MDCQAFKKQVMDLVLGELSDESRLLMEQHAAACPACGSQLNRVFRTQRLLKAAWPDEVVPTPLVFTPVASTRAPSFWGWLLAAPRWANVSMAAAAAFLVLLVVFSLTHTEFRYGNGQFALTFGQSRSAFAPLTNPSTPMANAASNTAEIERVLTAKYVSLSAQDRERYAAMLEHFSQQQEAQREADLQKIGSAFDQVKTVVWKEMQRNNAIVQYAAQRIATDAKN